MKAPIKHVPCTKCLHVWAHISKGLLTYPHTDIDSLAHKHTDTQRVMSNHSPFFWSCHMPRYPRKPPLDTNITYVICMHVWLIACVPVIFSRPSLCPSPTPHASSLRCHVNKARFSPSKGSTRQLPAEGDSAERWTGKMDRKRDKGELWGGAEKGRAAWFWVKARRLEKKEKDIQRNRSQGFVLSQPTCSSFAHYSVRKWSDSVLCPRTPIKWYICRWT